MSRHNGDLHIVASDLPLHGKSSFNGAYPEQSEVAIACSNAVTAAEAYRLFQNQFDADGVSTGLDIESQLTSAKRQLKAALSHAIRLPSSLLTDVRAKADLWMIASTILGEDDPDLGIPACMIVSEITRLEFFQT